MPCASGSVDKRFFDLIHIVKLDAFMSASEILTLEREASNMHWNQGIPGGFIHNTPQRLVNAFGDGSGYDDNSSSIGHSWKNGYWTAAVHQSDVTLVTPTEQIPLWLQKLGIHCRNVASDKYNISMSTHSFNLAVCNMYSEQNHEIAAHTDDNEWYAKDLPEGPMFASLTLYPTTKPKSVEEYARFEVFIDNQWHHFALPHASILLMPSCIPHRVRPAGKVVHPRINVTLRSVPSVESDPFNSLRGVSNHARYYRLPKKMLIPKDKEVAGHVQALKDAFDKCATNNGRSMFNVITLAATRTDRKKERAHLTSQMKKTGRMTSKLKGNVVSEVLKKVLSV